MSSAGSSGRATSEMGCCWKNSLGATHGWCGLWKPAAIKNGPSRFSRSSSMTRRVVWPSGVSASVSSVARQLNGIPVGRSRYPKISARERPSSEPSIHVLSRTSEWSTPGR